MAMKIAFLTSRTAGMIIKLQKGGLVGDVYSNKPNEKLESRCNPTYFNDIKEIPNDYDLYLLCGYMNIIPESFLADNKMVVNYHPSYLPDLAGIHPQRRAIQEFSEGKREETGGTIHRVDAGVDTGRIIYQFKELILPDDTVKSLTDRMEIKAVDFLTDSLETKLKLSVRFGVLK